jgi:gluconate 2-dehydrogenase alpha chain
LLLLSGIGKPYDPQSKGRQAQLFMQVGGRLHVFFDDKEFNPFIGGMVNTSIDELNGDLIDRGPLGFVGGAYINVPNSGASPIKGKPLPHGTPRWGAEWKKAVAHNYLRTFGIHIHGSCMSYRQHYLDLDPTYKDANGLPLLRMTFDWHKNEQKMLA